MVRGLIWLGIIGGTILLGSTVPLGKRTLFGHISAVWNTKEASEMREGISEKAGPAAERVRRGVEAGLEAARADGSGSAAPVGAGSAAGSGSAAPAPPKPTPKKPPKPTQPPRPKVG